MERECICKVRDAVAGLHLIGRDVTIVSAVVLPGRHHCSNLVSNTAFYTAASCAGLRMMAFTRNSISNYMAIPMQYPVCGYDTHLALATMRHLMYDSGAMSPNLKAFQVA